MCLVVIGCDVIELFYVDMDFELVLDVGVMLLVEVVWVVGVGMIIEVLGVEF